MPGLAGLITNRSTVGDPRRITAAFRDVGLVKGVSYQYRSYCDGNAVLLNTLTGLLPDSLEQPAAAGNCVLFLEGEIFNLDAIRSRTGCSAGTTPCEALLALYRQCGDDFVSLLNGEFNIVIYDRVTARLDVFCDHIASMPMYYLEEPRRLLFGSEKKFILSVMQDSPVLDPLGLLQVPAHRYNLDDRTFLKGVKRMMPGGHLAWQQNRLSIARRQLLQPDLSMDRRSAADLRDEWGERLRQATRRRLAGKQQIFVSLSGGLDSRAVACALPRERRPVWSRTRGVDGSPETTIAAEIAKRLGFRHVQEDPLIIPHSRFVAAVAWRTECETPYMNALSIANHTALRSRCHFIAGGWLGDASSGAHIPVAALVPATPAAFAERACRWHLSCAMHNLRKMFNEDFLQRLFPQLHDAFMASFPHLDGRGNIRNYELWDVFQRQRRQTTSSMPVDSYLFEKIRPFYDKEYLEFALSLRTSLRFGQTLYQSMIRQLGPEIGDIPSANNGLRLRDSLSGNLGNKGVTLVHRALTRRVRRFRPNYRNGIERRPVEDLGAAIRRDLPLRGLIERFLGSDYCDPEIFNRRGIRTMLAEHYLGVSDHSWLLGNMATLSAGLPYFLGRTSNCPEEAEPLVSISGHAHQDARAPEDAAVPLAGVTDARPASAR